MTKTMDGAVQFLANGSQTPGIALVAVVRVPTADARLPTVSIERLKDGQRDATPSDLSVKEVTSDGVGATGQAKNGYVRLTATKPGTVRGAFTVWEFLIEATAGGVGQVSYRINGLSGGAEVPLGQSPVVNVQPQVANTDSPVKIVLTTTDFPRLADGINEASPPPAPDTYRGESRGAGNAADAIYGTLPAIKALLYEIFFRLDAPHTLDRVWDQQSSTNTVLELSNAAFRITPVRVAEELWARQVSEMLLLSMYAGPAVAYRGACDNERMCTIAYYESSPFYGLAYACEHLTNFGVASRGILLDRRINAGSGAAAAVAKATPAGEWYVDLENPRPEPKAASGRPQDLMNGPLEADLTQFVRNIDAYRPPAVHLFSNPRVVAKNEPQKYDELVRRYVANEQLTEDRACKLGTYKPTKALTLPAQHCVVTHPGKAMKDTGVLEHSFLGVTKDGQFIQDNQGSAHVAFMLRARPELGKVQFFDTGALNVRGGETSLVKPVPGGLHKCGLDTPGTTKIRSKDSPFKGVGIFPRLTEATAGELKKNVEKLRLARPLGVARLALIKREGLVNLQRHNVDRVKGDGTLIYLSPGLALFGPEPDQNYSLVRLAWSLRELPGAVDFCAIWMVYVPTGGLARAMIEKPRSASFVEVARETLGVDVDAKLTASLLGHSDMVIEPSGLVKVQMLSGKNLGHPLRKLAEGTGFVLPKVGLTQSFAINDQTTVDLPRWFKVGPA
jgi:hypothetical protein